MVEEGFVRGSSDNLPYLDVDMINDFYINKVPSSVELKHGKAQRCVIFNNENSK